MGFELKITGNDAAELAQSAITFAFLLAPNLRPQMQVQSPETRIEAPAVEAETVEPARKPKRMAKVTETIEHDAKETKEDAHTIGGDGGAGGGDDGTSAALPAGENAVDEPAAEMDAVAEQPEMTVDDLRKFVIGDYLNTCYETQQERSAAFKALLKPFGLEKLGDLPAEKIGEFKAAVDARIGEKLAA